MSFLVHCIICDWSVTCETRDQARQVAVDAGRQHKNSCGCWAIRVTDKSRAVKQ